MARDAAYVLTGAVHQKVREFKEAEEISVGRPRPRGPRRTIRQVLTHEPFRWLRKLPVDFAEVDIYKTIGVGGHSAGPIEFRNTPVAHQSESTERIPVIHRPKTTVRE